MTAAIGLSGKPIYFFKGFSFFFTTRIRQNGTASKWVEAKFEVVVNPLPSLTTEADLPILVDVSFFFLLWKCKGGSIICFLRKEVVFKLSST